MIKNITVNELIYLMEKGEVLLVDVRDPAEHMCENIEGANLIPLSSISLDKVNLNSKSCPIVIHCQSGRRSLAACKKLESEDPSLDLYNLEGGIVAWKNSGYDTRK